MAQPSRHGGESNGPITWTLLIVGVGLIFAILIWITAAPYIVFYFSPLFHTLGSVWGYLPVESAASKKLEVDLLFQAFRYHSGEVGIGDWLYFLNICLKPYALAWPVIALWLFWLLMRKTRRSLLNEKLSPEQLSDKMMRVFSDIAPVVKLQSQIIADALPGWRRQTFPVETLQNARYQRKPVLVPDLENGGKKVDEARLRGYLLATKKWKDEQGHVLLKSHHLGRQIVDLVRDRERKGVVYAKRLSPAGRAVFAFLAPYAFGGAKGKKQSQAVKDALNFSAYGSKTGMANLSVAVAQESFAQWCNHPIAQKLAGLHHWEYVYLYALLRYARRNGKIGTWNIMWLKPMDRVMFYVLNTEGRATPHSEAALAFSQQQFELDVAKRGRLPINQDKTPSIFVEEVVRSYMKEWETWCESDDPDRDKWWQADDFDPVASSGNALWLEALRDMSTAPKVPENAV